MSPCPPSGYRTARARPAGTPGVQPGCHAMVTKARSGRQTAGRGPRGDSHVLRGRPPLRRRTHLLLPEDEYTTRLDGVPRGQVLSSAQLLPILEGLPHAVPRRPGDANVVPLAVTDKQGQLGDLQAATCR